MRHAHPDVPATMRAVALDRPGPESVLKIRTLPVPTIDDDEVLIAVDTAGVGSWDADMREGWWPEGRPKYPLVLGTDGSGIVARAGSRVRRLKAGEAVYSYSFANPKGGFYAEYVAVDAGKVAPIPKTQDLEHAGGLATIGLTALQGVDALQVRRDEVLLVHGASGGVGHLAVQFAKVRGCVVLATASGEEGVEFVKRMGADEAVDGKREDIATFARHFAPRGVDAVLALAGGDAAIAKCLDALREGGRLAYPSGVEPEPEQRPGIDITRYDAEAGVEEFARLNRAVESAAIQVVIAAAFPLDAAAQAHKRLAAGHVLGKIVLRIR